MRNWKTIRTLLTATMAATFVMAAPFGSRYHLPAGSMTAEAASWSISAQSTCLVGNSFQCSVAGYDANKFQWSVSDPEVATVRADGVFTGLKPGTVQLYAEKDGEKVEFISEIEVISVDLDDKNQLTLNDVLLSFSLKANEATLTNMEYNGALGNIVLPAYVTKGDTKYQLTSIGRGALSNKSWLFSLDMSNVPITEFKNYGAGNTAFVNDTKLAILTLPKTLKSIPNYMCMNCSNLGNLTIPASVTSIGQTAMTGAHTKVFEGCTKLSYFKVEAGNQYFKIIGREGKENGVLFDISGKKLIAYPPIYGKHDSKIDETSYTIPEGVEEVAPGAFQQAQLLKNITIPESVKTIGQYAFAGALTGTTSDDNNSVEHVMLQGTPSIGTGAFLSKATFTATGVEVSAERDETSISAGGKLQMKAKVLPYLNGAKAAQDVAWSVTPASVATISESGELEAKAEGTVTVTATVKDNSEISGTCEITVRKSALVESITITAAKNELTVGETLTLTAKVLPETADNKDVTWSVEGEAADISQEGVLTVKSEGVVTVKATAKDGSGVCGTMTVTVKKEQETKPTEPQQPATEPQQPVTEPKQPVTEPQQPETEPQLQTVKQSTTQATLKWIKDESANAGYRIYVKGGTAKKWTKVAETKSTAFNLKKIKGKKLQSGTDYQVRIVSLNKKGKKATEGRRLEMRMSTSLDKVKLTSAKKVKAGKIQLKWKKVRGAAGYEIQMKDSKNGNYTTVKTLGKKATSYKQSGLGKKKTIYCRIRAFKNVNGKKVFSGWTNKKVKI